MGYDYRNLSPIEFERLCSDLLMLKDGVRYQRFGEGRDGGIDLLYDDPSSGKTVVQCKRYRDTSQLIRVLKNTEVTKVRGLKPQRYCLLITASLTPSNKKSIQAIFSPFLATTQDIWGSEDLDGLLADDQYRDVVYNVPSLWLPSFKLVSDLINNAIKGRSKFEIEESMKKCSQLAWTSICDACMKRLESSHVVILEGDPGIGKTVTAEMLICRLRLMDYEVYISYDGITEFEDVYQPGVKQAFLYDDFLGSNYFDAVRNREDTQICRFSSRVSQDPTKCFILTSRTTILNRGVECSTAFQIHNFRQDSRLVDVNKVSTLDKAHILYKLLSSSNCNGKALTEYVREKRYWEVIKHENFNPRVIDYIAHGEKLKSEESGRGLASTLDYALCHPMKIWGSVFENQIDRLERVLVWMTYLNGVVSETQLNEAFDKLLLIPALQTRSGSTRSFASVSKTLVGSLLKRTISCERPVIKLIDDILGDKPCDEGALEQVASYELQNHSIADYLRDSWQDDTLSVKKALELLNNKKSLEVFIKMSHGCNGRNKKAVLDYLISDECTAKSIPLQLKAYSELVKDSNDEGACDTAFTYLQRLDTMQIDRHGVDSFIQILKAVANHGEAVSEYLQRIPAESVRQVFGFCDCIHDAITLYSLAPSSVFVDNNEVKEVISELLVEYGREQLDSWSMPDLEFDDDSGKMCASNHDIQRAEECLAESFNDVIVAVDGLQDMIDIWSCVAEVDVKEFYTSDCDYDDYGGDNLGVYDYGGKQIDNMFENLINNVCEDEKI